MTRFPLRPMLVTLAACALLGAGCATNPVSGRREFSLVSTAQEDQIGREGFPAVVAEYGLYDDARLQAYVDSVGQKLARVSHLPNLTWHFTLVDDDAVNAFAMPGGYIYVTRGILAHLNSEAQLAGVLGHEIGHVTARHTARSITKQQIAGLGLGLASMFSQGFQRYSDAAQSALGLLFLKYSRDDETQADELGVQYATAAGYDPREIPATYAMLKRVSERAGQRLPGYLSTHPDPGDREERTRALASQAAAGKRGLLVRGREYLKQQDGLVFGRDPREGYFVNEHYYHPQLAFQMTFPAGWKTQDTHSAVMAQAPDARAQMQMTLAPKSALSPSAFVADLVSSGRVVSARGGPETVGGYAAWVGRLLLPADAQGQQAILLAAFVRTSPDRMFQVLGQSASPDDADAAAILSCARSFRPLTDPARLAAQPDRVKVVTVAKAGDFENVVKSQGTQAADLETTAILNNAFPDQPVQAGELLKVVVPGRRE
jgi:predicted Zn-dependent protease